MFISLSLTDIRFTFSGKGLSPILSRTVDMLCSCASLKGALLSHSSSEITFREEGVELLETGRLDDDALAFTLCVKLRDEVLIGGRRMLNAGV